MLKTVKRSVFLKLLKFHDVRDGCWEPGSTFHMDGPAYEDTLLQTVM